jgi:hypothetical protein
LLPVIALLACHREQKLPQTFAPLEAEFAGCAAVLEGPVCELPKDRAIRVFVPGGTTATFSAPATELRAFPEGRLHRVIVPEGATSLTVEKEGKRFVLTLAKEPAYPWIFEARALRGKDPEAARTAAKAHLASKEPTERALALGLIARLDLASGKVEDAIARLRESIGLHTVRISDRVDDSFALAFALNQRSRRYAEARAALANVEPFATYPEARANLPFYRAEVALETGDVRTALRDLRAARAATERLAMVRDGRNARALLATVLQDFGKIDEGIAELTSLDAEIAADPSAHGCQRAEVLINLAFSIDRRDAMRRDRGEPVPSDELTTPTDRALSLFPDACPDRHAQAVATALSAAAALGRRDFERARVLLDAARPPEPRTNDILQLLDLEARLSRGEGDEKKAAAKYSVAVDIAETAHQSDMMWRALVGRAEVEDRKTAIDDCLRAESLLDDLTLSLPIGESRGLYLSRSEKSARLAIDLLLREHRDGDAFAVARRSRARLLSSAARGVAVDSLDAKTRRTWDEAVARFRTNRAELDRDAENDWKLDATALKDARTKRAAQFAALRSSLDDALAALGALPRATDALETPAPGELFLGFHRTLTGSVTFAATKDGVNAAPGDDALVAHAAAIAKAERIVLFPYGATRAVDLHAALLDRAPVVYALDVSRGGAVAKNGVGIVADPTNDLPAALAEANEVAALEKVPARVLRGTEATSTAVLSLLGEVSLFHYAGHGVFAGPDGTESRLPLAGGTQLGVLDVLAAKTVPATVILSACESGRGALDGAVESFGVAQAFVVAGTRIVIAPTRAVRDELARRMSVELHRRLIEGNIDPVEALRQAQIAVRSVDASADWAAFRAIRP